MLTAPAQSQTDDMFFKAVGSPANPKVQASWNKYNTNKGILDLCTRLSKTYPDLVTLESIGKSYQGRDIYVMTISDKKSGDPSLKPGYFIDGNIHSIELQGTEMALYTAWYLCEMFDENVFIKNLLAEKTFYICPTINPDGREFFTSATTPPRSGLAPRDSDRDGLADEDGPNDLNGDGEISQMRRKNPDGNMIIDPKDPRKMIRVGAGEKGEYPASSAQCCETGSGQEFCYVHSPRHKRAQANRAERPAQRGPPAAAGGHPPTPVCQHPGIPGLCP